MLKTNTSNTAKPINRISNHLNNGATTEPATREDYVSKIVFVEPPIGTFGAGEYIIVDQTDNALYGIKLGSAFDGSEVKLIPLIGPVAWTIIRVEPDTYGLIESTILLLSDFAETPREDRHEDLEDCIYEGADYAAGALLRMLERRQQERYEPCSMSWSVSAKPWPTAPAPTTPSSRPTQPPTTILSPVLLIDLSSFDMALAWII